MNIPISNDTEAHKQTQEELEEEYENAKSWLDELESARRSKKIDVEVARAKIRVLKLKIKLVNLEREKELASRLRMCSIPSKVHSYGRFPEMKPRECYCVHV
jgi:chromosome segregation ATPase